MTDINKLLKADSIEVIMEDADSDKTLIGIITDKFETTEALTEEVERIVDDYMYDEDGNLINGEGGFPVIKSGDLEFIHLGNGYEAR